MSNEGMSIEVSIKRTWVLSNDRETVRFNLPPLPIDGLPEPLSIHLNFDREAVRDLLQRLTSLYANMAPPTAEWH